MKVDFSQKFNLPDGSDLGPTLGTIALQALNYVAQGKPPLTLDEAVKRGNLALKVSSGGVHAITPEDAALIRSMLPCVWAPVVVAIAAAALEGTEVRAEIPSRS